MLSGAHTLVFVPVVFTQRGLLRDRPGKGESAGILIQGRWEQRPHPKGIPMPDAFNTFFVLRDGSFPEHVSPFSSPTSLGYGETGRDRSRTFTYLRRMGVS